MKKHFCGWIGYGVAGIWSLCALGIVLLLLVFAGTTEYATKVVFGLSNGVLMVLGIAVCGVFAIIFDRWGKKLDTIVNRIPSSTIVILSVLLFFVQAYVFYNIFFLTGWDSSCVVNAALAIDSARQDFAWYFSLYPNNLLLTWIYKFLFWINAHIGNAVQYAYFAILFQCLMCVINGGLLFSVVRRLSKPTYAYLVWAVYVVHVALSPWISILYSDAMALGLPLLIVWLYQRSRTAKHAWLYWAWIGAVAYIGFNIKPQVVIAFIAVVLVEVIQWFRRCDKKMWIQRIKNGVAGLAAAALCMIVCTQVLIPSLGLTLNPEREMGFTHFMMMGLNEGTNGVYSQEDVDFSASFASKQARTENNIRVIKERIAAYDTDGLLRHFAKKSLVIYGDGTYAWQQEGSFFAVTFEDRNETVSPFLKSLYYGDNQGDFKTFEQWIWVTLLIGCGGIFLWVISEKRIDPTLCAVVLSLIGLSVFSLLFEARARYLFIYAPFYIIIALFGWGGWKRTVCAAVARMQKGIRRRK